MPAEAKIVRGRVTGAAMCLVAGLGCAAHSKPTGAAGVGGNHVIVDGLSPAALAGVSSAGTGAATGMLGTWLYASGTATRTCPGEAGWDAPPEGDLAIDAGRTADEIVVVEPGACPLRFSRAGDVATIVPGQSCAGPDGSGGLITFSKMTWTLTLSADGRRLAEALTADETLSPAHAPPRTCAFTEAGVTLRRAP